MNNALRKAQQEQALLDFERRRRENREAQERRENVGAEEKEKRERERVEAERVREEKRLQSLKNREEFDKKMAAEKEARQKEIEKRFSEEKEKKKKEEEEKRKNAAKAGDIDAAKVKDAMDLTALLTSLSMGSDDTATVGSSLSALGGGSALDAAFDQVLVSLSLKSLFVHLLCVL